MIARLVLALVVFIVVGLALTALLGPILVWVGFPIVVLIGEFLVKWGWVLGLLAGLWHFFAGGSFAWPPIWRRP